MQDDTYIGSDDIDAPVSIANLRNTEDTPYAVSPSPFSAVIKLGSTPIELGSIQVKDNNGNVKAWKIQIKQNPNDNFADYNPTEVSKVLVIPL